MKIDWKKKLSSRKFWLAIIGLVSGLMIYFGRSEQEVEQVSGIILSTGSVVAYILAEGFIDAANAGFVYEDDEDAGD